MKRLPRISFKKNSTKTQGTKAEIDAEIAKGDLLRPNAKTGRFEDERQGDMFDDPEPHTCKPKRVG